MSDLAEKKPIDGPVDEQRGHSHEVGTTSDADMALAAMGYKPVGQTLIFHNILTTVCTDRLLTHATSHVGIQARVRIVVCL